MNGDQCDTSVDARAAPSRAAVSGAGTDRGATRRAGPPARNHAWLARQDLRAGRLDVSPRRTIRHRQRCHRVLLRRPCFRARVCRPILLRLSGRDDRRRFCDPRRHAATPARRPRPQDPLTRRSRRLTDLTNLADWVRLAATTFAAALLYAVSGYGFAVLATPLYLLFGRTAAGSSARHHRIHGVVAHGGFGIAARHRLGPAVAPHDRGPRRGTARPRRV